MFRARVFLDKPLVDEDEVDIQYCELSDKVKGIHMKPKGHIAPADSDDTDGGDYFIYLLTIYIYI